MPNYLTEEIYGSTNCKLIIGKILMNEINSLYTDSYYRIAQKFDGRKL